MAFFFAWVDQSETSFNSSHERHDENVFSLKREHTEGQIPLLNIEIRNPHVGLLSTGRKVWAWVSWLNEKTGIVKPLFFGRLVGVPTNMFSEVVMLQFIAKAVDYVKQKQGVAETMKVRPYWDPVFLAPEKRDDPDSILEGWANLWHVDPVSLKVTASSIVFGEDDNVIFTGEGDAFYDSVSTKLNQSPLTAVQVDATVSWNQTAIGTVDMGGTTTPTYAGDGIVKDWPKPLSQFGGGWSVQYSRAADLLGTAYAITASYSFSWKSAESKHSPGDTIGGGQSSTFPSHGGIKVTLTSVSTSQRNKKGQNLGGSTAESYMYGLYWKIGTSLILRYDANRQRTERIIFMLTSDLQEIITSPLVTQDSELITKQGSDVGVPIFNALNWTSVANRYVEVGQVIFPDNPQLPGGVSGQLCVVAGTTGSVEPVFSDVSGVQSMDNSAVWASMGKTSIGSTTDWTADTYVPYGAIVTPKRPLYDEWLTIVQDGLIAFPPVGASVGQGQVVRASNGSFQVCYLPGITGLKEPDFSTVWGEETEDGGFTILGTDLNDHVVGGSVTWISLGMNLPSGTNYFICTRAGTTGPILQIPNFNENLHGTTEDGTVVWTCIGSGTIPAGGYPTQVHARSYFPTDRGLWSLEYLISLARARILMRSRAVEVSWECPFDRAIELTCRKTATLFDPRLPGGQATGKIISCSLEASDDGVMKGGVTVACAVGNGGNVVNDDGTPLYVEEGYFDDGKVQAYTDRVVVVSEVDTDVGYSPPIDAVNDDGLVFPIVNKNQIVVTEEWRGDIGTQAYAVCMGLGNAAAAAKYALMAGSNATLAMNSARNSAMASAYGPSFFLSKVPIWYDLEIKPVVNGPFFTEYAVHVTPLVVPKMIDLGG